MTKPKDARRVIGKPFPKGVSGNPGGRKRVDPALLATLEEGNMAMLERLWELAYSTDERIALSAAVAWLIKTVPNAQKLELSGPGGAPIAVASVRLQLEARLMKLLGDDEQPKLEEGAGVRTP